MRYGKSEIGRQPGYEFYLQVTHSIMHPSVVKFVILVALHLFV